MEILNFIVIDDSLRSKKISRSEYAHTIGGAVYLPVETSLPVILKGEGCVGLGSVSKLEITAEATTIYFKVYEIDESQKKAYYALFRNQVTMSNSDDPYDNTDQIIPGMMTSTTKSKDASSLNYNRNQRRSHNSLSDFMDEDYNWD